MDLHGSRYARGPLFIDVCAVAFSQGFNMLGALILQVMERSEIESLKVMIYLIEGVLPQGYFCGSLGGLQADMAVFREILAARLPKLSKHLHRLQKTIGESIHKFRLFVRHLYTHLAVELIASNASGLWFVHIQIR